MKIYDRYNNVREKQAYHLSDEVVTVQDQSETIQSILERLSRGVDAGYFERRPLELDDEDVAMQLDYADELDARNMQLELQLKQDANKVNPVSRVSAPEAPANKVTPVSHVTAPRATSSNEVGRMAGSAPTGEQGASEASERNEVKQTN